MKKKDELDMGHLRYVRKKWMSKDGERFECCELCFDCVLGLVYLKVPRSLFDYYTYLEGRFISIPWEHDLLKNKSSTKKGG